MDAQGAAATCETSNVASAMRAVDVCAAKNFLEYAHQRKCGSFCSKNRL